MKIALWVVQALLAALFTMTGAMKLSQPIDVLAENMAWVLNVPVWLVRVVGISELLGAVGLIFPAATRIRPGFTPLASLGLLTIMVLAAGYHSIFNEWGIIPMNLVLGGMAAFVAYGRLKVVPIEPKAR